MGELGGIETDVKFAWGAAKRLSAELRSTADLLTSQIPRRNGIADAAKAEWRGAFSEQFSGRMDICAADAKKLARAMRQAADGLDELAEAARQEQARREQARAWEAENASETGVEKLWEGLTGTDEKPYSEEPIRPKNVQIVDSLPSGRG